VVRIEKSARSSHRKGAHVTDNLKGILAILIGSAAFVVNDAIVKLLTAELASGEIIVVRGAMATAMLVAGTIAFGAVRPIAVLMTPMMGARLAAAAAATIFIVLSLRHAPLATVNTVLQVTPLLVTAGAAVLYRERVGLPRWMAALTGFAGVLLIVQPGNAELGAAAFLVLAALACTTLRDLTTRGLERAIPSLFVAAASTAAMTLSGFLVAPFDVAWTWPTGQAWGWMGASAVCQLIANTSVIYALRTGEIAVVAPFRYVAAPLSILIGWWLWGDVPDALAWAGITLVIAAGLYTLHRERHGLAMRPVPAAAQRSRSE
jgi:drug/metabolite transporter (DMT)-like permease